jgi:NAD+ synthase (glutamine-hydrolysing)
LKRFIAWAAEDFDMPILKDFIEATPTAELEPITAEHVRLSFPATQSKG